MIKQIKITVWAFGAVMLVGIIAPTVLNITTKDYWLWAGGFAAAITTGLPQIIPLIGKLPFFRDDKVWRDIPPELYKPTLDEIKEYGKKRTYMYVYWFPFIEPGTLKGRILLFFYTWGTLVIFWTSIILAFGICRSFMGHYQIR